MKKELDIIVIQKKFYLEAEKNIDALEAVINKLDFNNPTIIVLHELSLSKYLIKFFFDLYLNLIHYFFFEIVKVKKRRLK